MTKHRGRNALEQRFIGKSREWKIQCSRCAGSKTLSNRPPDVIIKKLHQWGWQISGNPSHDVCPACQKKAREAQLGKARDVAAKALHQAVAPMVAVNGHRIHFSELQVAVAALDPQQAKDLIAVLRTQIPKKEPKAKRVIPLPESDAEYARWLSEQDK